MALYAQATIDQINRTRTGVVNKTYESVNGNRYIGKVGGFLELISPIDVEEVIALILNDTKTKDILMCYY